MAKPFSELKKGSVTQEQAQKTRLEVLEEQEAREKRTVAQKRIDKVAAFLNEKVFITDFTWPFLGIQEYGRWEQLSVSQYFPDRKLAVDKFMSMEEFYDGYTNEKERMLKDHGIKYIALNPQKSLSDLAVELGA